MCEDLIVFVEGEGVVKKFIVEFHGLYGDFEDKRGQVFERFVEGFDTVE